MTRKAKKAPEGAPDWLVTYGDMMTLLLCFFVLMFAYTVTEDKKYIKVKASLQRTFGKIPVESEADVLGEKSENLFIDLEEKSEYGGPLFDQGQYSITVKTLRNTAVLRLSGTSLFDQGKADILPEAHAALDFLYVYTKESGNIIEIRGHTSSEADDAQQADDGYEKWDLSWERSYAVLNYLKEKSDFYKYLGEERYRIVGASWHEPVKKNFVEEQRQGNRRIEFIVRRFGEE